MLSAPRQTVSEQQRGGRHVHFLSGGQTARVRGSSDLLSGDINATSCWAPCDVSRRAGSCSRSDLQPTCGVAST